VSSIAFGQALWLLVAALGLSLSVSYAGLPVLGPSAFIAVGGYGVVLLGPGGMGLPLGVAAAVAVLLAGGFGYSMAFALSRLDGGYLALATWALAWLAQRVVLAYPGVFGGPEGLTRQVPAHLVSRTLGVEVVLTTKVNLALAAGVCAVVVLALARMGGGPGGLDLAAMRESPRLAASLGVPVAARRRAVFTLTAVLGAVSGAGSTLLLGLVSPADISPLLSLQLFIAVLVGGTARCWGPVVGVALLSTLPSVADGLGSVVSINPERLRGVLTAVLLLGVLALRGPLGRLGRTSRHAVQWPGSPRPGGERHGRTPARGVELSSANVNVSYAGVVALRDVALALDGGRVHALVGPNGSGKSTLLDVLDGSIGAGEIRIGGRPHRARGVRDRVLAGVVRTPQRTVTLSGLTPAAQVALGVRGGSPSCHAVLRHLLATPRSRLEARRGRAAVAAVLYDTGLERVGDIDPARLTIGEQQLLQVARAIATGASVLLLDEPAAGMTGAERARLGAVLHGVAAMGVAVLIVEHDMRFVGAAADVVSVLNAGRIIASGPLELVRAEPLVRQAYLGAL
jgi:ABC-type branched-subunit amino acid transport system ATPase component/ABC-type branched-subunit amino acid transport system permease subunit